MRRFLTPRVLAQICALILVAFAFSQGTGQTGQGQTGQGQAGQGTTGGTGTTGQGTGTGQTPPGTLPTKEDPIAKIREAAKSTLGKAGSKIGIDGLGIITAKVNEYVTFRAIARNAKSERVAVLYSLKDAPTGAQIDQNSGVFSWVPTLPGTFQFSILAVVADDPDTNSSQTVTIEVGKPLELFGYSFFTAPRIAILTKWQLVQAGLAQMSLPYQARASAAQTNSLLPSAQQGTTTQPLIDPATGQPVNNATGTNPPQNTTQGVPPPAGGTAGTNTQGTGTTPPTLPNGQPTPLPGVLPGAWPPAQGTDVSTLPGVGQVNTPVNPFANPNLAIQNQASLPSPSALSQFLGPFDMVGGQNVFVPSPERYQLGAGDVLNLRIWSPTLDAKEYRIKVDPQGGINLPTSGRRVVVRGQTLAGAQSLILKELQRDLRSPSLTLTLDDLRTIGITVLGEAFMPGSYQVPAVATLFNALYIFGGPTDNGSLRKIELRRTDGTKLTFDLYRYLIYGETKDDVPLQPGDVIFIPPVEGRVTVQGEVGRPAIFEVKPGEHMKDLLQFAGDVRPTGVAQRISHSTVNPGIGRILKDVDVTAAGPAGNPVVYAGDEVEVFSVRPELTNLVTLEGAVDQPGQYALTDGLTIKGLVQRARGLRTEAYRPMAQLVRQNDDKTTSIVSVNLDKAMAGDPSDDLKLKEFDKLTIFRTQDVQWLGTRKVTVRGAVRNPGDYDRSDNMRIMDLLLQAGGLNGNAFTPQAFLRRYKPDGTIGEVVKIDLMRVLANDPTMNILLQDRDDFLIQSVTEAQFVPEQQVQVLGAVQFPGTFLRSLNLTLKDVIQMAGGLMPNAGDTIEVAASNVPDGTKARQYKAADVIAGTVNVPLEAGDLVSVPSRSDFTTEPRLVFVTGEVMRPGVYAVNSTTDRISDVIKRAGGPSPTAFLRGAQFVRDPSKLKTLSQERLAPDILNELKLINENEYKRALARAEVDKLRIAKSITSNPTADQAALLSAFGAGTVPKTPTDTKPITVPGETVSIRPQDDKDLTPSGNINVRLEEALKHPGGADDLVLEKGDILVVPSTPSTVLVVGAVMTKASPLHLPGKTVSYYIDRSGGFAVDAAKDRILVIRANGEVTRANARTRIELGDVILVPTKVMAERLTDRQAEVDAISKNITSAGVVFAILKSLLGF